MSVDGSEGSSLVAGWAVGNDQGSTWDWVPPRHDCCPEELQIADHAAVIIDVDYDAADTGDPLHDYYPAMEALFTSTNPSTLGAGVQKLVVPDADNPFNAKLIDSPYTDFVLSSRSAPGGSLPDGGFRVKIAYRTYWSTATAWRSIDGSGLLFEWKEFDDDGATITYGSVQSETVSVSVSDTEKYGSAFHTVALPAVGHEAGAEAIGATPTQTCVGD